MVSTNTEELITLTQAVRLIPSSRDGKKTSPSTLFRWASKGVKGVRLSVVQVGGARRTSRERLSRFFQELSAKAGLVDLSTPVEIDATARQAEIDRASARVAALVR